MDDELQCPTCQTDAHLQGTRVGEIIRITCTACGLAWDRDPSPRCRDCGTQDAVQVVSRPFIEKARGTQLSITGMKVIYLCYSCFRNDEDTRGYRHIPPGEHPAK